MAPLSFSFKERLLYINHDFISKIYQKNDLKLIKENKSNKTMTMKHPRGLGRTIDGWISPAEASLVINAGMIKL